MRRTFCMILTAMLLLLPIRGLAAFSAPQRGILINEVSLFGFVPPVLGEEAQCELTLAQSNYCEIVGVCWYWVYEDFEAEVEQGQLFDNDYGEYHLEIDLLAKNGSKFDTAVLVTLDGSSELLASVEATSVTVHIVTVSYSLTHAPTEGVLTEAGVLDYVPARPGVTAGEDLQSVLPAGEGYSIASLEWQKVSGPVGGGEQFIEGELYRLVCELEAEEGFTFSSGCVLAFNGSAGYLDPGETAVLSAQGARLVSRWAYCQFAPDEGFAPIHEVRISGFEKPVPGETAGEHTSVTVTADNGCRMVACAWYSLPEDEPLSPDDMFIEGRTYVQGVSFVPDEGCFFADDCVIVSEDQEPFGSIGPHDYYFGYVWAAPAVCSSGALLMGDADLDGEVDTVDALIVLRAALGVAGSEDLPFEICDVDGDGSLTTIDALIILRIAFSG